MTEVGGGGAVDHDPVTVVELLDFEISTELLKQNHHRENRNEQKIFVCL